MASGEKQNNGIVRDHSRFLPTFFSSMRATHERWHYGQYKSIGIRRWGGEGYLLNDGEAVLALRAWIGKVPEVRDLVEGRDDD